MVRRLSWLVVLTVFAASCGGSSDDGGDGDGGTVAGTTGTATEAATEAPGDQGSSAAAVDVNTATVVIGDDTYLFALDEGGSCNPSAAFGTAFRAILTRVDGDGNQVAAAGGQGTQGIDIVLSLADDGGASIGANLDMGWTSGLSGDTAVDDYTIDGSHASGTASFISENGDLADGTFEVLCE